MLALRTVLHPTDFSERSEAAFHLACSLARDHGARLIVLHVIPPPVSHAEAVARQEPRSYREQRWNDLYRLQAPGSGIDLERRLADGDPAAEILRVAEEAPCDLIVVGTHGRTGLGRLLTGSVAEQVLRRAACPVLTVRMPFPEAAPVPAGPTPEAASA
jgi:nucleotide-binding universal stress UspA family protein